MREGPALGAVHERACHAPTRALYLLPDGSIRACCASSYALGRVGVDRLPDVWAGARRAALVRAIDAGDFSLGCSGCGLELEREGPANAYPRQFDRYASPAGIDADELPALLGLYFANTCNLQCVQCHGGNSSAIRRHREHLPPIRVAYDERFFEDLRPFLAAARQVVFAGGEPFLIPAAFRTWEAMATVAPGVPCRIITNGTQWNERVERALDAIAASIVVSIDAATPATFARVRVGADLDQVLANLDRFAAATARAGTDLTINTCLMAVNHHEFADVLLLAEERGIHVDVSVVREPAAVSLYALPLDELRAIHEGLLARDAEIAPRLARNLATWRTELERLGQWLASGGSRPDDEATWPTQQVLGFSCAGAGPTDDAWARQELEALGVGRPLELTVAPGDVIVAVSPSVRDALGPAGADLVGRPASDLWGALRAAFGPSHALDQLERTDDWSRLVARFPAASVHGITLAHRGPDGRAASGAILLAVVPDDDR
jgi:molybdenum cofactor biosynthesis enzyme MoaA